MSFSRFLLVVFSALLTFSSVAAAKRLYRWVDENGITHFSDKEPGSGAERVFPSGMSVIPMRDNIRTQKKVERIKEPKSQDVSAPAPSRQVSANSSDGEGYGGKLEEERRRKLCLGYEDRIDWIDSRLRAGNYSVSTGNRLRAERRDLSSTRSWECLRNN